ncbi:MAG: thiamine-phosphate kinase, partial [Xenophilus sp.]
GRIAARQAAGLGGLSADTWRHLALAGGDDYELAFTAPAPARAAVEQTGRRCGTPVTRIGRIEPAPGLRLVDAQGAPLAQRFASFDHFGTP